MYTESDRCIVYVGKQQAPVMSAPVVYVHFMNHNHGGFHSQKSVSTIAVISSMLGWVMNEEQTEARDSPFTPTASSCVNTCHMQRKYNETRIDSTTELS